MFFQKKNFIFLHNPKCNGTTVNNLLRNSRYQHIQVNNKWNMDRAEIIKRLKCYPEKRIVFGHQVFYGIHEYSKLTPYYFTFMRNPRTLLPSHYNHLVKRATLDDFDMAKKIVLRSDGSRVSFPEFLRMKNFQNFTTRFFSMALNSVPESSLCVEGFLDKDYDFSLQNAKEVLGRMDFIGFTESAESDLALLAKKVGLKGYKSDKRNSSYKYHVPTNDEISLIEKLNVLDIELYDYSCSLKSQSS